MRVVSSCCLVLYAKNGALPCEQLARKLHFIVSWDVCRYTVKEYLGIEEHVRYVWQRFLAGCHRSCELLLPVSHSSYVLVSVHSTRQGYKSVNCDEFKRTTSREQL